MTTVATKTLAVSALRYLQGYNADTLAQVAQLVADKRLGHWLLQRYPATHGVRTDKALYDYVQDLKQDYLRGAEPVAKVAYDNRLQVVQHALGTHTTISRVQGNKLKSKREIRIASLFKEMSPRVSENDHRARAGPPQGARARQGVLQTVHLHGAQLPPARI